jgi:hypothetical protein
MLPLPLVVLSSIATIAIREVFAEQRILTGATFVAIAGHEEEQAWKGGKCFAGG